MRRGKSLDLASETTCNRMGWSALSKSILVLVELVSLRMHSVKYSNASPFCTRLELFSTMAVMQSIKALRS